MRPFAFVATGLLLGLAGCPLPDATIGNGSGGGVSTASSSDTSTTTTTSGAGGRGGSGGRENTGGSGGVGGLGGASAGTGGSGGQPPGCDDGVQNGSETGVDCGGPTCLMCPAVLILAGGPLTILGGQLFPPATTWSVTPLIGGVSDSLALGLTPQGSATAAMRASDISGTLYFATWSGGVWTNPATVGAGAKTRDSPSIAVFGGAAHVAYQDAGFLHRYAERNALAWSPVNEDTLSFGPTPPVLTRLGGDVVMAYAGNAGADLFDQTRTGGAWQAAKGHAIGFNATQTPAIVAPTAGAELLIVLSRDSDKQLLWTARTAGAWSAPSAIAGAFTADPPAAAALAGGDVIVAFRGTDAKPYATTWSGGAWSAPIAVASPNPTIASAPSVARGALGAEAEIAFVSSAGFAYHARLVGGSFTSPAAISATAGLVHAAIAAGP